MNSYNQDLEMGQVPYNAQGEMSVALERRGQINQALSKVQFQREQLFPIQQALLSSTSSAEDRHLRNRIDSAEEEITNSFQYVRTLLDSMKRDLDMTKPNNQSQVKIIGDQIRATVEDYRRAQRVFSEQLEAQVQRRYEIAHPEATEEEVREGVENVLYGNAQAFEIQGMRSHKANEARAAVLERSTAIRKIAQDLQILHELFQETAQLVEEQQYPLEKTVENTENTLQHTQKANGLLDRAVVSAKSARRYKWYILLVVILIIAIIVAASVGWCKSTHQC